MAIACSNYAFAAASIFGKRWSLMDEARVAAEDVLEEEDAVVVDKLICLLHLV
jgi:hypothetical protein